MAVTILVIIGYLLAPFSVSFVLFIVETSQVGSTVEEKRSVAVCSRCVCSCSGGDQVAMHVDGC